MSPLAGTLPLLRLALRRDRVRIPAWVAGTALFVVGTAASFEQIYKTTAERAGFAADVNDNPVFNALYGAVHDVSSNGGLVAWRTAGSATLLTGLMSLLLVTRHTRAEEEAGRSELLGSTAVGRHAAIVAALLDVAIANLAVAMVIGLGLVGTGLPAGGSFALGLAIASGGLVFGAVAAICAQIASTARAAAGATGALLGLAFLLRAAGDAGSGTLSWSSPIGWAQGMRSFGDQRWWVLALAAGAVALLLAAAFALVSRRDHGMGLLASRPGPATAPASLAGPVGLAWRLQRGGLLAWALGFAAAGVAVGGIGKDIASVFGDSQQLSDIVRRLGGPGAIADAILGAILGLFALVAAGYAIQAALRARVEETDRRGEYVLSASVSRWRWAGAHVACAALGTVVIMAAAGLAMGVVYGLRVGDLGGQVPRLLEVSLAQVPAAWVLGGVAVALTGLLPRLVSLAWVAFALCLGVGQLGAGFQFPSWALDLTPFRHVPQSPASDLAVTPLLALVVISLGLALTGLAGLRRRDIG